MEIGFSRGKGSNGRGRETSLCRAPGRVQGPDRRRSAAGVGAVGFAGGAAGFAGGHRRRTRNPGVRDRRSQCLQGPPRPGHAAAAGRAHAALLRGRGHELQGPRLWRTGAADVGQANPDAWSGDRPRIRHRGKPGAAAGNRRAHPRRDRGRGCLPGFREDHRSGDQRRAGDRGNADDRSRRAGDHPLQRQPCHGGR